MQEVERPAVCLEGVKEVSPRGNAWSSARDAVTLVV